MGEREGGLRRMRGHLVLLLVLVLQSSVVHGCMTEGKSGVGAWRRRSAGMLGGGRRKEFARVFSLRREAEVGWCGTWSDPRQDQSHLRWVR